MILFILGKKKRRLRKVIAKQLNQEAPEILLKRD
jgi:hypothetical protein